MPNYSFHLEDGHLDEHELDLPDDTAAINEGLNTASGMLRDLELSGVGKLRQLLEIKHDGETIFHIEVHATRRR